MGKKIPIDLAADLVRMEQNPSYYNVNNPYGYKINVNHPEIRPLYEHYKQKLGKKILSDAERLAFEKAVFRMMDKARKKE